MCSGWGTVLYGLYDCNAPYSNYTGPRPTLNLKKLLVNNGEYCTVVCTSAELISFPHWKMPFQRHFPTQWSSGLSFSALRCLKLSAESLDDLFYPRLSMIGQKTTIPDVRNGPAYVQSVHNVQCLYVVKAYCI